MSVARMTIKQLVTTVLSDREAYDCDEVCCQGCHAALYWERGVEEPTPLCHACAQEALVRLAKREQRARKRRR